jgi:L-ascorbate metabolism protein UlaG (beta-lactamase superfamily)
MMLLITFLVVLGSWAAWRLGWFTTPASWQETTGWKRIPAAERPQSPLDEEFELTWLGHAGFIVRWQGVTLLLDPNVSMRCTVSRRLMQPPPATALDIPVDAALISHAHYDHLNFDTLMKVRSFGTTLVPAGSETFFDEEQARHTRVRPVRLGESVRVGPLEIIPVPAAHHGNRFHPLHSHYLAVGYIIRSPTRTLYYSGDTAAHNNFEGLREQYHPHVAILPIGAYAPRIPLQWHHLNPEQAVEAAFRLGVEKVVPCHFGTFTLSLDFPASALPWFAHAAKARGLNWSMPQFATE